MNIKSNNRSQTPFDYIDHRDNIKENYSRYNKIAESSRRTSGWQKGSKRIVHIQGIISHRTQEETMEYESIGRAQRSGEDEEEDKNNVSVLHVLLSCNQPPHRILQPMKSLIYASQYKST